MTVDQISSVADRPGAAADAGRSPAVGRPRNSMTARRHRAFYLSTSPWIIGFLLLTIAPMAYALWLSLTTFDGISPHWRHVGLGDCFLFRQFFAGLPRELEEAAIVDGCGYTSIFWRIFLPQSWPVLSASFIIAFTWTWGDYIVPQLLLSTDRTTLAVAVMTTYVNEGGTPVPELQAAASVMYVVPILLIFLIAQRGFVAGMSTSGLK